MRLFVQKQRKAHGGGFAGSPVPGLSESEARPAAACFLDSGKERTRGARRHAGGLPRSGRKRYTLGKDASSLLPSWTLAEERAARYTKNDNALCIALRGRGMRVYFDTCSLMRPFDDQSFPRVRLETLAVSDVMDFIQSGHVQWIAGKALYLEVSACPIYARRFLCRLQIPRNSFWRIWHEPSLDVPGGTGYLRI